MPVITVVNRREIEVPEYGRHIDADQLKKIVRDSGSHFFDADTMRFFKSRLHDISPGPDGWYFVTSEKHESYTSYGSINEPRKYTIRRMAVNETGDDISIDEMSLFQEYNTLATARRHMQKMAKTGVQVCSNCRRHPAHHESWCKQQTPVNIETS